MSRFDLDRRGKGPESKADKKKRRAKNTKAVKRGAKAVGRGAKKVVETIIWPMGPPESSRKKGDRIYGSTLRYSDFTGVMERKPKGKKSK